MVLWGSHLIKSWSSTQSVVALYSGEAENYGMVKSAYVAIGLQSVLRDFQITCSIEVKSGASAASGIANRRGLGKVRHLEVCLLSQTPFWVRALHLEATKNRHQLPNVHYRKKT